MKNLYLWIVAVMTCLCIQTADAQQSEVETIRFIVNIPHASEVTCQLLGQDYPLTDGANKFEVPEGSSVYFAPKYPWKFSSIKTKDGKNAPGSYGMDWYLYANASIQDEEYTIGMVDINDLRTAQFTLNVDDPSLVSAIMTGYYAVLNLQPGQNIVRYEPNVETYLNLSPTDNSTPFFSVKQNGVSVAAQGLTYGIRLQPNCVIDVTAVLPDEEKTVTFSYSNGAENSFTLLVNNQEVTQFDGNTLAVKLGDLLTIRGRNTYKFNEVLVNGFPVSFYGSYSFNVMRNTQVHIDARPFDTISATVIVNDPELITISNNGDNLHLNAGENRIQLPETNTVIMWTVNPTGILNSVTVNGGQQLPLYPNSYTLTKGDVISFDVAPKTFDKEAIVWVDNTAGKACSSYLDLSSTTDRSVRYSLENGYNIVDFYQGMNPFTINWGGYDPENPDISLTGKAYLNGSQLVSSDGQNIAYHLLTLADGDVLKLFMDSDPVKCSVSFNIAKDAKASVVRDVIVPVENPSAGIECFAGTMVSISGSNINVCVNGNQLEDGIDNDGKTTYSFIVEDPGVAVSVTNGDDTGVNAVETETDVEIYNMQGIKICRKSSPDRLSPGLYIINGRKVAITE